MPMIWHIMKIYSHFGHKDFILCLGYKGEMFKEYFLNFEQMANDFTLKLRSREEKISHHNHEYLEDWNITFVDTREESMTGARVARVKKYLEGEENFFLTYGDGLANVDINKLLEFHQNKGKIFTLTCVHPITFGGVIEYDNGLAKSFDEKPRLEGLINGGFMVCNKKVFDYLSEDENCILEEEPLRRLASEGQLAAYHHDDFWYGMNTYKEYEELNKMWEAGNTPWKIWEKEKINPEEKAEQVNKFPDSLTVENPIQLLVVQSILSNYNKSQSILTQDKKEVEYINKNFWQDRNVFVTGCGGFLGSWLVKYLAEAGANVTGLVRDIEPKSNLYYSGYISKINLIYGDFLDRDLAERVLGEYEIDTVFHLGAQPIVPIANRNPLSTFESNMRGTWQILEACRRSPLVKRIIIASSDKAYGNQPNLPYTEEMPLQGEFPYDVSKSCVDLISQSYFKTYNLPVVISRCGNFYGGGDLNFNRIVPGTIKAVIYGKQPIIRSDGSLIRDYFYIEDVVRAYLLLAENLEGKKLTGQAFNFSSGQRLSVIEMVSKILQLMGSNLRPEILNQAPGEIKTQYLSSQKANLILGWQSRFSLEEGLTRTINWYREFLKIK
jgi:CDP-glucose 4,6-dehydratase